MKTLSKIGAVVLAAGASTRMGQPKQLLSWKSTTLLNHCIQEVTQADVIKTVIVLGSFHEEIQSSIINKSIHCILNSNWESGMGSSIAAAAEYFHDKNIEGLLFVVADQPFVNTDYINLLISEFDANQQQIVATNYKSKAGVPALFGKKYLKELSLLTGKQGAKDLIQNHTSSVKKITPDFDLQDIDTPEEYRQLSKS